MSTRATGRSPSTAVVMAVAEWLDREPTDLPPLQGTIDTDALDALFSGHDGGRLLETNGCELRFSYAGLNVRVTGSGAVTVEPPERR